MEAGATRRGDSGAGFSLCSECTGTGDDGEGKTSGSEKETAGWGLGGVAARGGTSRTGVFGGGTGGGEESGALTDGARRDKAVVEGWGVGVAGGVLGTETAGVSTERGTDGTVRSIDVKILSSERWLTAASGALVTASSTQSSLSYPGECR